MIQNAGLLVAWSFVQTIFAVNAFLARLYELGSPPFNRGESLVTKPRPCPIPGCPCTTRAGELLCAAHWRAVPSPLKSDVWTSWRMLKHRRNTPRIDPLSLLRKYRLARDAAIAAVAKMELPLLPVEDAPTSLDHISPEVTVAGAR